ncbi:MAG: glycosyltransferase, partial [Cetobacterium sp.]
MNILMALSQLEVTGAEVYATTLSDELISRDNNVYIVSDTLTKESKAEYFKIQFNKRSFSERFSQVKNLLKIIKEKDIHVIHAHSRASSWSASIAAKIAGIPLVTTIHGRQPVHLSRKIIKSFGDYSIAVCENIKNQVINDLGVNSKNISVLRNPIDETKYPFIGKTHSSDRKIISIIGRLSGPKGEVTLKLLEMLYKRKDFKIQVIGGKVIPQEFKKYEKEVDFLGYIDNVS